MYFNIYKLGTSYIFFWNKHICLLKPTFGFRKTHLHFENHIVENHMWVSDICVLKTVSDFWNTYVFFKNQINFFDKHFQFWKIIVFESCDQIQICVIKRKCDDFQMWFSLFNYVNPNLVFENHICFFKAGFVF